MAAAGTTMAGLMRRAGDRLVLLGGTEAALTNDCALRRALGLVAGQDRCRTWGVDVVACVDMWRAALGGRVLLKRLLRVALEADTHLENNEERRVWCILFVRSVRRSRTYDHDITRVLLEVVMTLRVQAPAAGPAGRLPSATRASSLSVALWVALLHSLARHGA